MQIVLQAPRGEPPEGSMHTFQQTLKDVSQPGVSLADKKEMINDIRADLQRFIDRKNTSTQASNRPVPQGADPYTVAQAHSQDFLDLKAEIGAFKGTFDTFAAGTESNLNPELNAVEQDTQSHGGNFKVKAMGIAMGVTAVGTGAATVAALFCGPFGPMISLGIMITGALALIAELGTLIAYLKKKADAEDELSKAKTKKAALEKDLTTLQAVKPKLATQTTDITYICQCLDQFANIWAMVAQNAREVDGLLATAAEPTTFITTLTGNIAVLKSGYGALYNGLKAYATNVAGSGVPKPTM
ncbi:hypothetical protein RhiJN_25069 [Ceratobasidium sp. AG-Ba]|nr:hypothetical protein RhiJN_25069 [Ceratobasidium sp. AG-Ba]